MKPRIPYSPPEIPTNDEILHSQRRQGEAVTILVVDGRDVPDQIASLGVESNDVGVKRGHEYLVAEDGESAVHAAATWPDVRRELTLVEPDRASSTSVESERAVVLAGGIEDCRPPPAALVSNLPVAASDTHFATSDRALVVLIWSSGLKRRPA